MKFEKGKSGNPSGRPKGAAGLASYIAEKTDDGRELIDRLIELSRDPKAPKREALAAVMALLDRVAGKPISSSVVRRITDAPSLPAGFRTWSLGQREAYLDDLQRDALSSATDLDAIEMEIE